VLDLSRLSSEQRQAVLAPDGPLLIVAGPGSGKTTLLAAKIAHLVTWRQVSPQCILALTFATKAARELQTRLLGLLGDQGSVVDVSTFHAFGLRVARTWSYELGMGPGKPVVYAEHEARALLRDVAESLGIDPSGVHLAELAARVERRRLNPQVTTPEHDEVDALVEAYEDVLRRRCGIDYVGMLTLPLRLFANWPRTLRLYQDAYRAVLVDEFQDVCSSQYALLRELAALHRNLIVVGDPRQSLYGWRGAEPRFMEEFHRDFSEARTVGMSQNFRSTGQIVDLANALGSRLPFDPIWTDNPGGDAVRLHAAMDEMDEAAFVAKEIQRLIAERVITRLGEVAILFRTNHQAMPFTLALRQHHLPYRVRGTGDLFARREVRDLISYLRLAHNPEDALALARIINVPPRRLSRLADLLREIPVPTSELHDVARPLGRSTVAAAESLVTLVTNLYDRSVDRSIAELIDLTLDSTGYASWLENQPDGQKKVAGVHQLRVVAERSEDDLGTWLAHLQLDEEMDPGSDDENRVLLSTIHRAKGGEWRAVFVVGMEEGLLPHARARDGHPSPPDGIEEELKVAYVAVTRARERLYLTYCQSRQRGGTIHQRHPSRFLQGLSFRDNEQVA